MTAEIAVFNKSAVSLAADSAVTISGSDGISKIYNGADKLFALSKHHPMGIMVFGSADLCGIPWEIIIKQYRKNLGTESFKTVEEYAENFWEFLCLSEHIIPMDMRENYLIDTYKNRFFPTLIKFIEKKRIAPYIDKSGSKPSIPETFSIIEEEAMLLLNNIKNRPFFEGFTEDDLPEIFSFSRPYAQETCLEKFDLDEDQALPESLIDAIGHLFAEITCKNSPFGRNTGLVFAGYGDNEYMPAVLAFDVLGFYRSKLRLYPNLEKSSSGGQCGVKAYAQEQEVETFLNGLSNNLKSFIFSEFKNETTEITNKISERVESLSIDNEKKEELKTQLSQLLDDRFNSYQKTIDGHIEDNFTYKVIEMIEFLPKLDLAYMAESLVNLTVFKRKVSNDNETVGGPIDVAIISKGDGFIWVKRKHYFDKSLNHHYFSKKS